MDACEHVSMMVMVKSDMDIIIDKTNSMTYRTHAALRFSYCVSSIRKRVSDREGTHELVSTLKLFLPGHLVMVERY